MTALLARCATRAVAAARALVCSATFHPYRKTPTGWQCRRCPLTLTARSDRR